METIKKLTVVLSAFVLVLVVAVGPAAATEAGGEEGAEKIQLPERQHDFVGLFILGAVGIGALLAFDNARRQLKGERKQASGEFRWR